MFFDEEVLGLLSANLPRGVRPVSVLGQGGCGVVVRVQSDRSSDNFAMKIAWKGNEGQIQDERKVLESLRGASGVVRLFESGDESAPYFACEIVMGRTMEVYFKRGMVTVESALRLTARLADIVGGIHARGIVHRDLKPENVIVKWSKIPSPVVIDFGLAMRFRKGEPLPDRVAGTLPFMSPEAFDPRHPPGPAQDLYALGIILYWICTGDLPFKGENMMQVRAQHYFEPISRLPSAYPARLNELVNLNLQKDHRVRLSNAKAFGWALREVIEELGSLGGERELSFSIQGSGERHGLVCSGRCSQERTAEL